MISDLGELPAVDLLVAPHRDEVVLGIGPALADELPGDGGELLDRLLRGPGVKMGPATALHGDLRPVGGPGPHLRWIAELLGDQDGRQGNGEIGDHVAEAVFADAVDRAR